MWMQPTSCWFQSTCSFNHLSYCWILMEQTSFHVACRRAACKGGLGNSSPGAGAPRVTKKRPLSRSSGHGVPSGTKELWQGCFEGYTWERREGAWLALSTCVGTSFGVGESHGPSWGATLRSPLSLLCMLSPASGPRRWCETRQDPWSYLERLLPTEPKTTSIELFKRTCFVFKKCTAVEASFQGPQLCLESMLNGMGRDQAQLPTEQGPLHSKQAPTLSQVPHASPGA